MAPGRPLLAVALAVLVAGCTFPFGERFTGPGDAASSLVSGQRYPELLVEFDHPPGFAPHPLALSTLESTLKEVTGKTSIRFTQEASVPADKKRYTFEEIARLADSVRTHHTGGDVATLHVLYLAGGSEDDTDQGKVLGAAYRGTSLVMFKGNIKDASASAGGLLPTTRAREEFIERAVLVHEFGHAAGLVNLGTPMRTPHEDGQHKGHSSNRESVMYYAVENTAGLSNLLTGGSDIPFKFDANDKADLAALREGN